LRATDSFHKTKLCKFWPAGHCTLGAKCRFAHSTDEVRDDQPEVTGRSPKQNQQYNNSIALPTILTEIQPLVEQQQKLQQQQMQSMQWRQHHQQWSQNETYSGCATPEYDDFDTAPMPYPHPAMLQHLNDMVNGKSKLTYDPEDSERLNSCSTLSDCPSPSQNTLSSDSQDETAPWDVSGSDFPPMQRSFPPMQPLPFLLVPVQQMRTIENDTGDVIDHYTGDVEITQAPIADETPFTPLDDIWQADKDYQVKNTFISVKDEPTFYPLRCVRSAGSCLTKVQNLS